MLLMALDKKGTVLFCQKCDIQDQIKEVLNIRLQTGDRTLTRLEDKNRVDS